MDAVVRLAADIQQSRNTRKGAGFEGGGGGGRKGEGGASHGRPWARHIMGAALPKKEIGRGHDRYCDQGVGNSSMVEGGDVVVGVGGSGGGAWEWGQGRSGVGGGRRSLLRADNTGGVHEVLIVQAKL